MAGRRILVYSQQYAGVIATISVMMYPKLLDLDEKALQALTSMRHVRGLTYATSALPGS